jgi:hypothetical protein
MLSLMILSGCSSTKAIYNNYETLVDVQDGVSSKEAKIMAQKVIISTHEQRHFRITAPDVKTTPAALKYSDYWFVVFGHNWFSPMSTDPLAKTYTELRETQFVVVIEKKTGNIKFSGLWYPKRANNFDWVFEPNAYKEGNSLALPPYEAIKARENI